MFSTTFSPLPHMMAHASSAGAPFDSEVSNADLDSEAFATTPSATTPSTSTITTTTTTTTTEAMDLDMLTQLLDSTSTTEKNCASLLSDPSVIAMSATSSTWDSSPSISPLVLKLESPLLSNLADPDTLSKSSRPKAKPKASAGRKRSSDPLDKEAKARERVLRNRAAAQESRDKKRKYMSEIEASNESLQQENSQLLKRLKTVENDNMNLSQRLETLTAQFAQMQQLLSQSIKQNQSGTGFCQSAVLAKKDKKTNNMGILTNSPQQKLVPSKGSLRRTNSNQALANNRRQPYSMTMKNLMMSKKEHQNKEARLLDQSAAQNRMEISCRSFCNNISCNQTSTLSSSAAVSFLITRQSARQPLVVINTAMMMLVFLANILPQLMLNFSTLFLISTGARSSNPQELQLQQAVQSFIQQLSSRQQYNNIDEHSIPRTRNIKDNITSIDLSVIEEIVTEFRQGHKDVARGLLVKALLLNGQNFNNNKDIKRKIIMLHKK